MELRGFEPLILPAEMGSDVRRMFADVVTSHLVVLRICVGVLRDVTVPRVNDRRGGHGVKLVQAVDARRARDLGNSFPVLLADATSVAMTDDSLNSAFVSSRTSARGRAPGSGVPQRLHSAHAAELSP